MKKIISIFILCCLVFSVGCTKQVKSQTEVKKFAFFAKNDLNKSSSLIDNEPSYVLYFDLDKPENSLYFQAYRDPLTPTKQKIPQAIYYLVEKQINISQYKNRQKTKYYFLDKNFNSTWKYENILIIKNSQIDPLKKLSPGQYRIRFTDFTNDDAMFKFIIIGNKNKNIKLYKEKK